MKNKALALIFILPLLLISCWKTEINDDNWWATTTWDILVDDEIIIDETGDDDISDSWSMEEESSTWSDELDENTWDEGISVEIDTEVSWSWDIDSDKTEEEIVDEFEKELDMLFDLLEEDGKQ